MEIYYMYKNFLKKTYDYIFTDYIFSSKTNKMILLFVFIYSVDIVRKNTYNNYIIIMISTLIFLLLIKEIFDNKIVKHPLSILAIIASLKFWINAIGHLFLQ